MNQWSITCEEKLHLRELAKKQREYSMLPVMKEREGLWYRHNDLRGERPTIHFETWTCEKDLLPPLKCISEAARSIELQLNREVLNHEMIGDDRVVPSWFNVGWAIQFILFNHKIETTHSTDSEGRDLAYRFKHPIQNLQEDLYRLEPSVYTVDREQTMQWKAFAEEILGDILPVRMGMGSPALSLSQEVVRLMGMEAMIYALVDYPDEFHQLMNRITQEYIGYLKWMEKEGLLFLNNGNDGLAQGSFGFTGDLPGSGFSAEKDIATRDLWGYMDSQETVSISPDMYGEFFFPYYLEGAKQFGLLSYGCCEPVHAIWEKYVSRFPNLRKVSISAWCDEAYMGQALQGSKVIYHRKPSPNFIGVGTELDEGAFREHIRKTIRCARGCKLEFSFRDVYSLGGNNQKPRRAVQIIRELLEEEWK